MHTRIGDLWPKGRHITQRARRSQRGGAATKSPSSSSFVVVLVFGMISLLVAYFSIRSWAGSGSVINYAPKPRARGRGRVRGRKNPAKLRDLRCKHRREFEAADRNDRGIMPDQESPRNTEPKHKEGTILRCPTPLNRRAVHASLTVILPCLFPATNTC